MARLAPRPRLVAVALASGSLFGLGACEIALGLDKLHAVEETGGSAATSSSGHASSSGRSSSAGVGGSTSTSTSTMTASSSSGSITASCKQPGSVSSLWGTLAAGDGDAGMIWRASTQGEAATSEANGVVTFQIDSSILGQPQLDVAQYESADSVSLLGCSLSIELSLDPDAGTAQAFFGVLGVSAANSFQVGVGLSSTVFMASEACDAGTCTVAKQDGPTGSSNYAYLRVSETDGTLSLEYSPDGKTWSTGLAIVTPAWASQAFVNFALVGAPSGQGAPPATATFQNVSE